MGFLCYCLASTVFGKSKFRVSSTTVKSHIANKVHIRVIFALDITSIITRRRNGTRSERYVFLFSVWNVFVRLFQSSSRWGARFLFAHRGSSKINRGMGRHEQCYAAISLGDCEFEFELSLHLSWVRLRSCVSVPQTGRFRLEYYR